MTPTTIVIQDPLVLAELARAQGQIEFRDPTGNVIATLEPVTYGKPPPGYKSPISDEELERRRQVRDGRPLADILRDLEKSSGS